MAISELIRLGDKVDLQLVHQMENAEKTGTTVDVYKSQVLDKRENGNYIISMPIQNGRLILLSLGVRYELTFYSQNGMYQCIGQIVERYKKDNIYMLEVELKTQPQRYQRREYYRYNCALDIDFFSLSEEQKKIESAETILNMLIEEGEYEERRHHGITSNISGGGLKFRSETELKADDYILIYLRLINERMDSQLYLLGKVIACDKIREEHETFYDSRIQFQIKENKKREEIIRYIFEEERKLRRKENG